MPISHAAALKALAALKVLATEHGYTGHPGGARSGPVAEFVREALRDCDIDPTMLAYGDAAELMRPYS